MNLARALWLRIETVHAVTYFGQETVDAGAGLGLGGFWASYFAFRGAPLGPVAPAVIDATFFNFAPSFVRRWVPDVWLRAAPDVALAARSTAAVATLRRLDPHVERATVANAHLRAAARAGVTAGRPLFAANLDLPVPDDPVAELWHWTTCLREHRGDGHVAALTAAGVDGLQAHVLIAFEGGGTSPEDLQRTRGWTADDWVVATERCRARGWLRDGELSAAGRAVRAGIEATTDELASGPFAGLASGDVDAILAALTPLAGAISTSGTIRYPNPIGLPAAHEAIEATPAG